MEYQILQVPGDQLTHDVVVVSIEMSDLDWYALRNSLQWSALENFLDDLKKLNSHCNRQETQSEISSDGGQNSKKKSSAPEPKYSFTVPPVSKP